MVDASMTNGAANGTVSSTGGGAPGGGTGSLVSGGGAVAATTSNAAAAAAAASAVQENVAELQFGPEFGDIHVLSNAQVAVILQVSANSAVTRDEELNEVYRKTQRYVNRFNSMTNPEKEHQELVDELDNLQE